MDFSLRPASDRNGDPIAVLDRLADLTAAGLISRLWPPADRLRVLRSCHCFGEQQGIADVEHLDEMGHSPVGRVL